MTMIKISELKPTVFTEMEKLSPNLKLFEIIGTGVELDNLYIMIFGERLTTDTLDSAKVANYMKMLYSSSWDTAYYLFQNTANTLPDLGKQGRKTTLTEYKYTDTTKDTNSVPSFDSVDLNTETQKDMTFTHSEINDDNINRVTVTNDDKDIAGFKPSYDFLLTNWVIDIVFNDLNRFITQHIHN